MFYKVLEDIINNWPKHLKITELSCCYKRRNCDVKVFHAISKYRESEKKSLLNIQDLNRFKM